MLRERGTIGGPRLETQTPNTVTSQSRSTYSVEGFRFESEPPPPPRTQYPLIKEYTLNHNIKAPLI